MTTPTELPKYRDRVAIEESIAVGWAVTKKRFLPMFLYNCLAIFLTCIPSVLASIAHDFLERNILFVLLLSLVSLVFICVSTMGIMKMTIMFKRGQDFSFDDFLSVGNSLLSFMAATVLTWIVVGTGLIFFIIPGIIFSVRLSKTDYFIIDKKMGPLQAMSASWTATRGCVLMLILFHSTMHVLIWLGMLALIIGLVPAYMIMMVAKAQVYDRLVDTCPELAPSELSTEGIANPVLSPVVPASEPFEVASTTTPADASAETVAESAIPTDVAATSLEATSHAEPASDPRLESPTTSTDSTNSSETPT